MKNQAKCTRVLSILVCFALLAAVALGAMGCQKKEAPVEAGETVAFTLVVVDGEGKEEAFALETAEKTVGAALLEKGMIEGENGQYGLYVKTVNGITADYETDGTYWAFYIDGEYAMTGVDTTEVRAGATYTLKVEK